MRRLSPLVLALILLSSTAWAHSFPVERSAVLQVHTSHADLLLVYVEPPGPRTDRLLALYDANRNGQIDGVEQQLARRAFLQRAFYGFDIGYDCKSAAKTAEIRYKRDKNGGISVAVLQRFDLIVDSNDLTISLSLSDGETIPPIDVIVEPADKWTLKGVNEPERHIALKPGSSLKVPLSRTPTLADGPVPAWTPNLPAD